MIEVFKELWYKRKVRVYRALIQKMSHARLELHEKQTKFTARAEHYEKLYKDIAKI